jgi:predicted  nucleic acid-binding Zn-ribbon protein
MPDALNQLHECEQALDELSRRRGALPGRIAEAEAGSQAARDVISSQHETLEEAEKQRREREAALQDTEAQREKFKGQSALVKTNVEYTALLREIDQATDNIGRIEEEILVAMERIEEVGGGLEATEREQEAVAKDFDAQAAQLRDELRQVEGELETRAKELDEQVAELEADVRHSFERARKAKGTGTTTLSGRVCSSCHRDVPFEDINRVLGGEIVPCQSCRRLLVLDPAA